MPGEQKLQCGLCHYWFDQGVAVCQGCQGTIVYGATVSEAAEGGKTAAFVWGLGAVLVIYLVPFLLKSQLGWSVAPGWGMDAWGMIGVAAAALWGYSQGYSATHGVMYGQVRTFRRRH